MAKMLSSVNMNTNCDEKNGYEAKEDNGMNKNREPTGFPVAEFYHSAIPW